MALLQKKQKKTQYYDIQNQIIPLMEGDNTIKYALIFGERSAGKSTSVCMYSIKQYVEKGIQTAFIRRFDDDWGQNVANTYFNLLVSLGYISKITKGEWDNVYYYGHRWYFCRYDNDNEKLIKSEEPFAYAYALNTWEKTKATQQPNIKLAVLEEFISRVYIGAENTEFNCFVNLISTLARNSEDFKVLLLGNSIAKYGNPYFICMGIEDRVLKMKQGEIVVFEKENSKLKIVVEYTKPNEDGKKSDILFEFDNTAANQVTTGEWQLEQYYPILPLGTRIKPKDIIFNYFIIYKNHILQADIILQDKKYYTFIHRKTTEIKNEDTDLIYDLEYHLEHNYKRDLLNPVDDLTKKVAAFYKNDSVYVQDPEIGEILHAYISCL